MKVVNSKSPSTKTSSIAWPNMINVVGNTVAIIENAPSVVNRSRLLFLTEPTEIYNEPNQGVGLKRHLWHYNNDNEKAIIMDRIKDQLRLHEPQCSPNDTQFADGNLFTGSDTTEQRYNKLEMTVAIKTKFSSNEADEYLYINNMLPW